MTKDECGMTNAWRAEFKWGMLACGWHQLMIRRVFWCGVRMGGWELRAGFYALKHADDFMNVPVAWCRRQRWHCGADDVMRHTWSVGLDVFSVTLGRRVA